MSADLLTDDQREALQEIVNIAMGQAGSRLAQLLSVFVHLSVPRINVIEAQDINQAITAMVGAGREVSAVRQAFFGAIRGEAIMMFDQAGDDDVAELMGYDAPLSPAQRRELLLDVSNVLVGACLAGIGELLGTGMSFSAPSMMAESTQIERLLQPDQLTWRYALLVEVNFALEARNFTCHLTQLMPEASIGTLQTALDQFIESL